MNEQEWLIVGLLLNEMAFEAADKHFGEVPPDIPETLLTQIGEIGVPHKYDRNSGSYQEVPVENRPDATAYEQCYAYLRTIRNNIIHANKAYEPDTPERLKDLLAWANRFITAVYETDSSFAQRAKQIKDVMRIESF